MRTLGWVITIITSALFKRGIWRKHTHTTPHTKPLTHRLLETFQIQITVNR